MASINVSLPEAMRSYVEKKIMADGYGTVSEYVRHLIREAQKREAEDCLEQVLLQGLESGATKAADADFWRKKASRYAVKPPAARSRKR